MSHYAVFNACSVLVAGDDIKQSKPDPEGLLKACEALKIKPENAIYIGDLPLDIEAANACNMDCALILHGYHAGSEMKCKQTYIFSS